MSKSAFSFVLAATIVLSAPNSPAHDEPDDAPSPSDGAATVAAGSTTTSSGSTLSTASKLTAVKKIEFATLIKDATTVDGLIKLYRKEGKLYAELPSARLDKDFIVLISIARGMGESPLLGGMSWGFGDDWLWQFRKVEERIQVVRRNVRFTAAKGSPEARAVELAYTDSVLFSLPIVSKNPDGVDIVDLSTVFMGDLPQISNVLSGFTFSKDKSSWATVKSFKDNVELEVAATYSSSGKTGFDTVADSRGVTVNVHYSISLLPETGYTPRMGDDRVGYFLTATKDFSKKSGHDRFVRYVNRWDLRKSDASAELSPPKKPIVFWIEKTVPYEYRKPIREGILEWNRAFEAVGIANAIEVRQQPDDAEWEPEDINYNTFRWITSGAGFAMGPSRVNPTTGEILDADIIFDADFLLFYQEDYDVLTVDEPSDSTHGRFGNCGSSRCGCTLNRDIARELAFGWALLEGQEPSVAEEAKKTLVTQALKETAMHEVGHTLGLRHNFRASAWLSAEEMADHEKTASTGLAASVMDYLPMNIVPRKADQGDYFSRTIGPYDHWAIEYGYKPLDGGTEGERADLQEIAARCAEPALAYATDEDTRSNDPDPLVNRFDLGKDPLEFAKLRLELIGEALPGLVERLAAEGEDYHRVRRAFNILLSLRASAMHFAARHIGGLYVHRHHRGDPDARPPFVVVEAAKQREALALLEEHVFGETAYQFPPDLYAHLSPAWWSHWGTTANPRTDYPIHEVILTWQSRVLSQLLSSITLERLIDSELKVPADQDAFTAAEMIERLTSAIFGEVEGLQSGKFTNREPAIHSLRRSLQREYLSRLANLALGNTAAPIDCQTVATLELRALEARIRRVLAGKAQLDTYTRAHLTETAGRIRKVLNAQFELRNP